MPYPHALYYAHEADVTAIILRDSAHLQQEDYARFLALGILTWEIIQFLWDMDHPYTFNIIGEKVFDKDKKEVRSELTD